ncbi:MAG: pyruvate kinase [Vampirovibrionales bacterium]|nr:pyruvate kinase [Vampirovibrionales bacterium]
MITDKKTPGKVNTLANNPEELSIATQLLPDVTDISFANRTKIVATIGPASSKPEMIQSLILAGVSVFRMNFSHGEPDEHRTNIANIRKTAKSLKRPVAVLVDLQGPKLRTAYLKDDRTFVLAQDEIVTFTTREKESSPGIIATKFQEVIDALNVDGVVLINDGKIRLRVSEKVDSQTLKCQVVVGGVLEARKGINIPGSSIAIGALTDKDKEDALLAVEAGADYLAMSFVQRGQDITELKAFLTQNKRKPPAIIAKIEKPQALLEIGPILEEADGLMVARGDLGVELRPEEVPIIQKQLVRIANETEKPVIIATQMLESMLHALQPARSDVSDIANAVFDGADALMLSGETAMGEYPVETVSMMRRIIQEAEKNRFGNRYRPHEASFVISPNFHHAIAHSACYAALKADVKALVVLSNSGTMAQRVSKLKPPKPIIVLTPSEEVYNRISLLWGVIPFVIEVGKNTDEIIENGERVLLSNNILKQGDSVVFCGGKTAIHGANNMLKIYALGESV